MTKENLLIVVIFLLALLTALVIKNFIEVERDNEIFTCKVICSENLIFNGNCGYRFSCDCNSKQLVKRPVLRKDEYCLTSM